VIHNPLDQAQVWVGNREGDTVRSYRGRVSATDKLHEDGVLRRSLCLSSLFYEGFGIFLAQFPEILGIDRVRFAAQKELFVFRVRQIELGADDCVFFHVGTGSRQSRVGHVPVRPKRVIARGRHIAAARNDSSVSWRTALGRITRTTSKSLSLIRCFS
jgi:hypothetical protein